MVNQTVHTQRPERDLERAFGDPRDSTNPVGFAEALAAESRGRLLDAGTKLLDDWGCDSRLVHRHMQGSAGGMDAFVRELRPAFRRDMVLGLHVLDTLRHEMPPGSPWVPSVVAAGLSLGTLDAALRVTVDFAVQRHLYGGTVLDLPHARSTLVHAFADLLVADCMSATCLRGLHVLPEYSAMHTAATNRLVLRLLRDGMNAVAVVLGARSYLREGEYAVFGKHLRDLPKLVSRDEYGSDPLVRYLPLLAARPSRPHAPVPTDLFRCDGRLPPLSPDRLIPDPPGLEPLTCRQFVAEEDTIPAPAVSDALGALAADFDRLRTDCALLTPVTREMDADGATAACADRFAIAFAAACCVQLHRHAPTAFLAEPHWLAVALHRLVKRLGGAREPLCPEVEEALTEELMMRYRKAYSFTLDHRKVIWPFPNRDQERI